MKLEIKTMQLDFLEDDIKISLKKIGKLKEENADSKKGKMGDCSVAHLIKQENYLSLGYVCDYINPEELEIDEIAKENFKELITLTTANWIINLLLKENSDFNKLLHDMSMERLNSDFDDFEKRLLNIQDIEKRLNIHFSTVRECFEDMNQIKKKLLKAKRIYGKQENV